MGYRYRIHYPNLPGRPDLAFPSRKKVIFVNGCFWHRHTCKQGNSIPKSNTKRWEIKFHNNVKRDNSNQLLLQSLGWEFLEVWECEIKSELSNLLEQSIEKFLGSPRQITAQ